MGNTPQATRATDEVYTDILEDSKMFTVECPREIVCNDTLAHDYFWYITNGVADLGIRFLSDHSKKTEDFYQHAINLMTSSEVFNEFAEGKELLSHYRTVDHVSDFLRGDGVFVSHKRKGLLTLIRLRLPSGLVSSE